MIEGKKLHAYLSRDALVSESGRFITRGGYIREELLDTLLLYPELGPNETSFTFTYLHAGDYFLTVIADIDNDGYPSPGDVTHSRRKLTIAAESHEKIKITDMNVRN